MLGPPATAISVQGDDQSCASGRRSFVNLHSTLCTSYKTHLWKEKKQQWTKPSPNSSKLKEMCRFKHPSMCLYGSWSCISLLFHNLDQLISQAASRLIEGGQWCWTRLRHHDGMLGTIGLQCWRRWLKQSPRDGRSRNGDGWFQRVAFKLIHE